MKKIRFARLLASFLSLFPFGNPIYGRRLSNTRDPFFIISAGRSGSTLLNRILNEHKDVFLPSEQYFLGVSILKYRIYRPILWRDLVKVVIGELVVEASHTWDIKSEPIFRKLITVPKANRSLRLIIDTIFTEYALQKKEAFSRWGDSTPLNSFYINELRFLYPNASFLFLIRDGREVVASYAKGGKEAFGELSDPLNAANYWNNSIRALDYLEKNGCNILLVKYEDLVADPEGKIQTIAGFLGIDYDSEMLDFYKRIPDTSFYNKKHHEKLQSPIISQPANAWNTICEKKENAEILPILNNNLKRFGYIK